MGEGFMGGCTPPFTIFFDFRLRSLRYEKDFFPVLSKLSQASMVKNFHFSDKWKMVSVAGHVHKLVVKIGIFRSMLVILPLGDN